METLLVEMLEKKEMNHLFLRSPWAFFFGISRTTTHHRPVTLSKVISGKGASFWSTGASRWVLDMIQQ